MECLPMQQMQGPIKWLYGAEEKLKHFEILIRFTKLNIWQEMGALWAQEENNEKWLS